MLLTLTTAEFAQSATIKEDIDFFISCEMAAEVSSKIPGSFPNISRRYNDIGAGAKAAIDSFKDIDEYISLTRNSQRQAIWQLSDAIKKDLDSGCVSWYDSDGFQAWLAENGYSKSQTNSASQPEPKTIPELMQSSQYYGLINTSIAYDYDSLIGKSCNSILNTLKKTKSKSGDFTVSGLYFGIDNQNKASWAATIVEPKNDCDRHFGFSCKDYNINKRLNFSISSDTGLGILTTNSGGGKTFIDYDDASSGYVQTTHYYGEKAKNLLGKSSVNSKNLLCFEPK